MTRTATRFVPLLLTALLLSGCAVAASPVIGVVYTDVQAPLDATANAASAKTGEATCESILGIIATGDCSIATAAQSAGITRIHYVDYKTRNILGFYATFTVVVYGE